MRAGSGWYLIAYDIANPKRLQRVYRFMRRRGWAAQKSLFFIKGHPGEVQNMVDELIKLIHPGQDDIRAYPVGDPGKVWMTGGFTPAFPIIQPGAAKPKQTRRPNPRKKTRSLWKKLFFGGKS